MPRLEVSDRKDSSSAWTSHSSRSKSTSDHGDDRESDRDRRQTDYDHSPDPDPPNCLRGETCRSNPLNFTVFLDKDKNLLVASHLQYLYDPSRYPHLIRYDSNRPLPNLLLRLGGTPLLVLADLLQYPPPISSTVCPPSDWLRAQAWFLDDDRNPRRHPVFEHPFLTMESLGTIHEDFMIMFSRDIPPWIMRKMDNERPYCELGGHNQLNHYLLGWCWFWLQMEVSQRVDRVRAFLVEEDYEKLKGKEGTDWERERERIRREREEKEDDDENPFKKFGVNKVQAIREARDFVERMSGIGALWFPDSEKKGKFEKYGDVIPSKRKLSGEGNTREYCVACNLSVVAGSGEEVLAALLANMISRAPCKNEKDVAEEDGGLPKLYPLVDAWIENLGEERAKVVKEKAKKLALTLFTIRKYLRWKGAPQGRDKWLYTDLGTDPYHPHDMNLTPSPTIRMMKEEKAVKKEWECFCKGEDPLDEEKKPSSSLSRTRIRESYSSKHTVPLSFYNLTNSQVSPAPTPSRLFRHYINFGSHSYEITAAPIAVQGTVTVPGTSTALVRTRDYPSEEWDSYSNSDSEFDDATTLTCNSFTTIGTGTGTDQRLTNFSNDDDDDDNEIISVTTWSHLSAVPEALNFGGPSKFQREERETQTQSERERYREERERYRHEGESLMSQAHNSQTPSSAQHLPSVTDTRDWAANGGDHNRDRDRDRELVDRERYRHGGSSSSSTSSRRGHHSHRRERDKDDEEPTRIALKLLSIKDHLHLARKKRGSGWERIKEE